jgi:hypothetical protein
MKHKNTRKEQTPESEFNIISKYIFQNSATRLLFVFEGPAQAVKKIIRELFWGGVLNSGTYTDTNNTDPSQIRYDLEIEYHQFNDLVNMFWYLEKRFSRTWIDSFSDISKTFITYKKDGEYVSAPAIHLLQSATHIAHERQNEPLIIREAIKPDDLSLWTDDELQTDEIIAAKLKEKLKLDKKKAPPVRLESTLPNEFDFAEEEEIDNILKKIATLEFFQTAVLRFENYFLEIAEERLVNKTVDKIKLLEPEKDKQLLVLLGLLERRHHEKDKPLFMKTVDRLISNHFFPAIMIGLESVSRGVSYNGKDKLDLLIDLLTSASQFGEAEASCCLAKIYMGMIRIEEYLRFNGTFEITSQESRLQIDMKKAIRYLNLSVKQGFTIAYLSAAYDLAKINFEPESLKWNAADIQQVIDIMEKGYALPSEEPTKKVIATKLEQLRCQYTTAFINSPTTKPYYASALLFWNEKVADTVGTTTSSQSSKTDTSDIPSDKVVKAFSFWRQKDEQAKAHVASSRRVYSQ